jgi:peptidoglycan/LPS O-acetylase OafA/YrhL
MSDAEQTPGGNSVEAQSSARVLLRGQSGFRYVPALDGLRGVAMLVVLIYHAVPESFPGGFLGVELFFVLSGFLITSLLLKEHDRTGIQLGRFYMRRVLRLAPAMIVMLASVVLLCRFAFGVDVFLHTASDAAFSLGYIFNWVRASDPGRSSLLGHTWSLCIEEQFYLLWPLGLLALLRIGRRDRLTGRILLAVAAIILWRLTLSFQASPMRLYNGLDTRADGLLLGCALAAAIHDGWIRIETLATQRRLNAVMPVCVVAFLALCCVAHWTSLSTYLLWLPVTGVLSATLICTVMANAESLQPRFMALLESRLALFSGKLSYGLYLWHYPTYRMMTAAGASRLEVVVFGTSAAFVLAVASWRLVEKPMLRLKDRFAAEQTTARPGRSPAVEPAIL